MSGAHTIDIEQLVKSITTEQEHGWLSRSECTNSRIGRPLIHRTNENLRNKYKNAYEPIMFFLGPYNHQTQAAHARQVRKYKLLELFLDLNHEKTLSDYLEGMRQLEKPAKCCYANDFNLDRNYFVKMLLLNGCFVLMSLLGTEWCTQDHQESESSTGRHSISGYLVNSNSVLNEKVDQDEGKLETIQSDIVSEDIPPMNQLYSLDFWHDALLLENQIPFFVISKLYEWVVGESGTTTANLTEKIVEFVEDHLTVTQKQSKSITGQKSFFICFIYHTCTSDLPLQQPKTMKTKQNPPKRGIIVHQLNSDAEVCDLFRMIMECAISSSGFDGYNYLKSLCSKIEEHYQNKRPFVFPRFTQFNKENCPLKITSC